MMPPSQTFPLFPYTTLFRSGIPVAVVAGLLTAPHFRPKVALLDKPANGTLRRVHQDRKSTRLNSSHANISYAVFCLKKKNDTAAVTAVVVRTRTSGRAHLFI